MLALSGSHFRQSLLQRTCWIDKVSKEREREAGREEVRERRVVVGGGEREKGERRRKRLG